jgi:hypothetical protein
MKEVMSLERRGRGEERIASFTDGNYRLPRTTNFGEKAFGELHSRGFFILGQLCELLFGCNFSFGMKGG